MSLPCPKLLCFPFVDLAGLSKAPCKHVVELARAEVSSNPTAPEDLRFSRIRLEDAEVGVHQVLRKHGLACTVDIDTADLGPGELRSFPYIRLSSWLSFLTTTRIARQFCGVNSVERMGAVLKELWKRFRVVHPTHQIFDMASRGVLDLPSTIPYFSHSDEGRTYKKEALWIFSVHGCIGRGTCNFLKTGKHKAPLSRNQMGLNFVGHSLSTQFLYTTMLRETSAEHPEALQELLKIFADDVRSLCTTGFVTQEGFRLWCVHLGTKGDLPALGKLGNFDRKFSNVPRASSSRTACGGICPRCLAGQESDPRRGMQNYPYEDLGVQPAWKQTIDQFAPYNTLPYIMRGVPVHAGAETKFFCFDIWHIFHLGICKHYLGSSFVAIIESNLGVFAGHRSVESRFGVLSEMYRNYCRQNKFSMWVSEINRDTLVWPQASATPIGKWNKGSASTTLMLFLAWFSQNHIIGHTEDEIMLLIVARLKKNESFWGCWLNKFWMELSFWQTVCARI